MTVRYAIDQQNEIIEGIVSGLLSRDILLSLLTQLKDISDKNQGFNLLFDLRHTSLEKRQMDMHRVIDFVSAIIGIKEQLGGKIAHVVPDNKERIIHAEDIGSVARIRDINYRVFTNIEQARNWLANQPGPC